MKRLAGVIALVCLCSTLFAQEVPTFEYHWSVTGERYSLVKSPLRQDVFGVRNLSFDAVAGVESRRNIPAYGIGLTYALRDGVIGVNVGAYVLNRTNPTTDVAVGLSLSVKF